MSRPKAVFLTQYFPPETFAGANRAHAMADALAETHDLRVVGLCPSYPHRRCYDPEATARFDAAVPFAVHRRSHFTPHRYRSPIGRAVGELRAAVELGLRALRLPADVVITSVPSMFLGPAALVVARLKRAVLIWDVRDITWTMAAEIMGGSWLFRILASALQSAMWATARRCDLLVAATPGIARIAAESGVPAHRIVTVENGITDQLRAALAKHRDRTARSRSVVTYVGLLGHAQRLTTLIEAAQRLPSVDFVIAGEGPQRSEIEDQIRKSGCDNVRLTGYVQPSLLPELFGRSDLLFAQVIDSPVLNQTARPSKLLEYMAAGRPIVYAGNGDAAALINEIGCGVCTAPGDTDAITNVIEELLGDDRRLDQLGRRGAAYIDSLPSRHQRMVKLAETVQQRFSTISSVR